MKIWPYFYILFLVITFFKKKIVVGKIGNLSGKFIWGALDDVVMGGVSESSFQIDPTGSETGGPTGLFKGLVLYRLK